MKICKSAAAVSEWSGPLRLIQHYVAESEKCSCCMLRISYTHWSEVWKQVCCNYFKYKNANKNWRSTGLTYRHLWGYFGAIKPSDVGIKSVPREKKNDYDVDSQCLTSTWFCSIWYLPARPRELFDKLRKTSFAISTSQTDCLLVETTSDQKLVYLWRRVLSDTKIYFRKGPRPDSCGFWFLNYITVTAVEVVFTMVVVGISTLHERVFGNVHSIRGLFALHLIVLW